MSIGIDINTAKQYNEALKQARNNAATLSAQKNFLQNEVESLCAELSAELGENVTIENAQTVLEQYAAKIENTVNTGNIVLAKINNELANNSQPAAPQMTVQQQAVEVQPGTPVAPVAEPTVAQTGAVQVTVGGETPQPAAAPAVSFGETPGVTVDSGSLPPLFKM